MIQFKFRAFFLFPTNAGLFGAHWQCELQERKYNFNLDGAFRRMIEKSTLISVLDGNGNLFRTVIDDIEIKRQKYFERHGPKLVPNDAFLQSSLFSLQTTFKAFFWANNYFTNSVLSLPLGSQFSYRVLFFSLFDICLFY
jgi:hypothetical protein